MHLLGHKTMYAVSTAIIFGGLTGCTGEAPSTPVAICLATAKVVLANYGVDDASHAQRCECVRTKRKGVLPDTETAWELNGENNALQALMECSKKEIVAHYQEFNQTNVGPILKRRGFTDEQITAYSACAGEISYQSFRNSARTPTKPFSEAEEKIYTVARRNCESAGR